MTDLLAQLLVLGGLALLVAGFLAPFETLGWWAGWFGDRRLAKPSTDRREAGDEPGTDPAQPRAFVVYFSGIGSLSGDTLSMNEQVFLGRLDRELPEVRIVSDVFPYSAAGIPLNRQRLLAAVWTYLRRVKIARTRALSVLINLRNLFQVLVAADTRYGPLYDFGVARRVAASLIKHGYNPDRPATVLLLGVSGGAQVAIGAAAFISRLPTQRLEVVSIGGVMAADPGLDFVDHLSHLYGTRDRIQKLGRVFFPRRWPIFPRSSWQRALRERRVSFREIGTMAHNGRHGYFAATKPSADQPPHLDVTLEHVILVIRERLEAIAAEQRSASPRKSQAVDGEVMPQPAPLAISTHTGA